MEPIRVMIADMTPNARVAVRHTLVNCSNVRIVADASLRGMELLVMVRQTGAELVLLGVVEDDLPPICSHLLAEFPHLKILGVDAEGSCHSLYETKTHARRISLHAPERLQDAILQVLEQE